MNEERLKQLIDRYYDGNTSEEEEAVLREYFSGNDIIPGFEEEKEIFFHYSGGEICPNPSIDLEQRILKSIDDIEKKHIYMVSLRRTVAVLSIAATVLMLIGSYYMFFRKAEPRDTYSDPQIAYVETLKILNNISEKLNKGTMKLQPLTILGSATHTSMESIDKSASLINSGLRKIEVFNNLSESAVQTNNIINNK